MFEEAQLYSPVTSDADGAAVVHLGDGHPGAADRVYQVRRNRMAASALAWRPGEPIPRIQYTEEEHEVWQLVCTRLDRLHQSLACAGYLAGKERLDLPREQVPQLADVNARLTPLTGFRYVPAAGLVPLRQFYGLLADGVFHSTQYLRHHSLPLYTPEPDVIHEVIGHGNCLASERFAALYLAAGEAARRVTTRDHLEFVSKVFWFSLEFGVLRESGGVRTYGAGLLSSYGEIQQVGQAELHPLDITRMGVQTYDITQFQPLLFCAESFTQVEDVVGGFFAAADDETVERLLARAQQLPAHPKRWSGTVSTTVEV